MDKFVVNCEKCFAPCCKKVGCDKITADNKCSIYSTRPITCRAEDTYELFYEPFMSKEEYKEYIRKNCERLRCEFKA
jgi:Fe-S-cluster containining protein